MVLRQAQHERVVWSLSPHPATPPCAVTRLEVILLPGSLQYSTKGAAPLMPVPADPVRTDDLWRTTCFELFVKPPGGTRYFEFNFSPSTQWAAYEFDDYRLGMRDLGFALPLVDPSEQGLAVMLDLAEILPKGGRIGLSAVIEETDGTKSYWALAHPPGTPDFHHDACFALELPAPDAT
jgi:hypothetical protein